MSANVKERPILFSAPMVRALLDGSKTQTRRVANFKPRDVGCNLSFSGMRSGHYMTGKPEAGFVLHSGAGDSTFPLICPYGQPGDRLWVREAYGDAGPRLTYRADLDDGAHCMVKKWTPSIHMFRADSRILLEIVSVRVERLNDCSAVDAIAEGIIENIHMRPTDPRLQRFWRDYRLSGDGTFCVRDPINSYRSLWESINGSGSWASNPWVWVIEFKRVAS